MLDKKETLLETSFTNDEAQLYDRQIRLWGLEAQKRLRASRVLVIGMRGLGAEVSKNLVLAGVKSLNILDTREVTSIDFSSQFLAPRSKIGMNIAEASLERLQQLNPMVSVTASTLDPKTLDSDYFKNIDVVIVSGLDKESYIAINALCRQNAVKFYAGDIFGFFGYFFVDLLEHEYTEEVVQHSEVFSRTEAKGKRGGEKSKEEPETKILKGNSSFVSFEKALAMDWTHEKLSKRIKRMDPSFFVLQMMYEFYSKEGIFPSSSQRESHIRLLTDVKKEIETKYHLPDNKIPEIFLSHVFGELSPVAAIVGGVLSQEVIKALSNKDVPHNNFFFYNPYNGAGIVEKIGK